MLETKYVDIRVNSNVGETLLHYAVREQMLTATVLLVDKGADVNAKDQVSCNAT
jgi:ankyrin repeat protein